MQNHSLWLLKKSHSMFIDNRVVHLIKKINEQKLEQILSLEKFVKLTPRNVICTILIWHSNVHNLFTLVHIDNHFCPVYQKKCKPSKNLVKTIINSRLTFKTKKTNQHRGKTLTQFDVFKYLYTHFFYMEGFLFILQNQFCKAGKSMRPSITYSLQCMF